MPIRKSFLSKKEQDKIRRKTPIGIYGVQKSTAKQRNIDWSLTFDEWWKIWQDSGHWEERGRGGYCMCRKGDEGPYSIDNVYIETNSINSKHGWINGKGSKPPIQKKRFSEYQISVILEKINKYGYGGIIKVSREYSISREVVRYIKSNRYFLPNYGKNVSIS